MTTADQTGNARAVRRVVVAGGGTAGWVAATALVRLLGPLISVTLVESDAIGTVGVGEATIPTARSFHDLLRIDEQAFMRATQATFKLGIAFENWGAAGERYFHAFGTNGPAHWMADFHHAWLHARTMGLELPLGDFCAEHVAAERHLFARGEPAGLNYAYHLDATLYARFLRRIAENDGVVRIEGEIASVERSADTGDVAALHLKSGQAVAGDLFIDCTGFRGLLIEQTLEAGFEDWSQWLGSNSAVAVQSERRGDAVPYTTATAHQQGWRWHIPLQRRSGNGLVFDRGRVSDDEAAATLLGAIDGPPVTDPRFIRYVTGRRRRAWSHNCVALGLASGFVEPLESTSIHLVMVGITRLIRLFPYDGIEPASVDRYNAVADAEMEHVRDFIILHYHLNQRGEEPLWADSRALELPASLAERIASFKAAAHAWQGADELFRADSWVQVMLGQGLMPASYHPAPRMMAPERLLQSMAQVRADVSQRLRGMPRHQPFVAGYCPADPPSTQAG